eukprot:COSAG02_NODE_942_length_15746_cov_6.164632_6_plen_136_part_00
MYVRGSLAGMSLKFETPVHCGVLIRQACNLLRRQPQDCCLDLLLLLQQRHSLWVHRCNMAFWQPCIFCCSIARACIRRCIVPRPLATSVSLFCAISLLVHSDLAVYNSNCPGKRQRARCNAAIAPTDCYGRSCLM